MKSATKSCIVGSFFLSSLLLAMTASAQPLEDNTTVTLENIVGVLWQKTDYPDIDGYDPEPIRLHGSNQRFLPGCPSSTAKDWRVPLLWQALRRSWPAPFG